MHQQRTDDVHSVLVKNGVIEKIFVAPGVPGDSFKVSDADPILAYLAPRVSERPDEAKLSHDGHLCSANVKAVFHDTGVRFQERAV